MHSIVGLGNPGKEYEETRHNAGRIVLEHAKKLLGAGEWKEDMKTKSLQAVGTAGKAKLLFLLPNNFMNNSGASVAPFIKGKKDLEKLVVAYDDLDIPLGEMKISFNKNSGGHNGVESIIKKVKSKEFLRIRIGIMPTTPTGKPKKPKGEKAVLDFLMKDFKEPEMKELKKLAKKVAQVIELFATEGKDKTMSVGNSL